MKCTILVVFVALSFFQVFSQDIVSEKLFMLESIDNLYPATIQRTSDNGYILSCFVIHSFYKKDNGMIKLNSDFDIEWHNIFNNGLDSYPEFAFENDNNEFIFIGKYFSRLYIQKMDNKGNKTYDLWDKQSCGGYYSSNIILNEKENEYVYLSYASNSAEPNTLLLAKYDSLGIFKTCIGIDTIPFENKWNHYGAATISETSDKGFIIAGAESYSVIEGGKLFLLKVDSNGEKEWRKVHEKELRQRPYEIMETSDGNYIVVGRYVNQSLDVKRPIFLRKYDKNGNEIWETNFLEDAKHSYSSRLIETADSGFVFTGEVIRKNATKSYYDFYLAKVNKNGEKEWEKTWLADSNCKLSDIIEIAKDEYIVLGRADDDIINAKIRIYIAKIVDNTIGVNEFTEEESFSLLSPNPATDQITISLDIAYTSTPEIDIIDMLGFCIKAEYNINDSEITINTSLLDPGIYFLRIRSGGKVETRKFVVVR